MFSHIPKSTKVGPSSTEHRLMSTKFVAKSPTSVRNRHNLPAMLGHPGQRNDKNS